ncbi:hypothetical protein ACHQM5_026537 [Ranunculus cassubicifolius]
MHHSRHKQDNIVFQIRYCKPKEIQYVLLSGDELELSAKLDFDHQYWSSPEIAVYFIGSCNGIICFYSSNDGGDFALWNPAMKQLRTLPKSPTPYAPFRQGGRLIWPATRSTDFGFDIKTNDYKVVQINPHTHGTDMPTSQVEVYNLSSDSWRIIYTDILLPVRNIYSDVTRTACKNGMYIWLGSDQPPYTNDQPNYSLLSFDLGDEVFGTIPLPKEEEKLHAPYALDFVGDKLAYIKQVMDHDRQSYCEIWVLDDFRVKNSWAKRHNIGPMGSMCAIGLTKNGDYLIATEPDSDGGERMLSYNLVTHKRNCHQQKSIGGAVLRFVFYKESLVSIK